MRRGFDPRSATGGGVQTIKIPDFFNLMCSKVCAIRASSISCVKALFRLNSFLRTFKNVNPQFNPAIFKIQFLNIYFCNKLFTCKII